MRPILIILFLSAAVLSAQEVASDPIGFNKVTCLANSDTIVGVPLRKEGSLQTILSGAPTGTGDSITLPVAATLTAGQFNATSLSPTFLPKYYVKFNGGAKANYWYSVQSNTATSITINLNGDNLTGAASSNPILVAEYWTLNTLFPPSGATTSWTETPPGSGIRVPNGHAVVGSNSNSALARRTEILMPNVTTAGINLAPASIHFISGTTTKVWTEARAGGTFVSSGNSVIYPDTSLIIRHSSSVAHPTTFANAGEVLSGSFAIPLATSSTTRRDIHIAIPRPIPLKLSELGLAGTSAFVSTGSVSPLARKDELLVYNNAVAMRNRVPSAVYFVMGGNWQKIVNNVAVVSNDDVIQPGHGVIIRKSRTTQGQTVFWQNPPTY